MNPVLFPEANAEFGPPQDMAESQVSKIPAFVSQAHGGSVDGSTIVVVAWQPTDAELEDLKAGKFVYISMMGGLAPHFLTTNFKQATTPA